MNDKISSTKYLFNIGQKIENSKYILFECKADFSGHF